jgi:hypothetical protein
MRKIEPLVFRTTIQVEQFRIEEINDGGCTGYRSISTGFKEETIEVQVDLPRIVKHQGKKACNNTTGLSRDGYVLVKKIRKQEKA